MHFLHNPHSYALSAQQHTSPCVTRVGLYNHTLVSPGEGTTDGPYTHDRVDSRCGKRPGVRPRRFKSPNCPLFDVAGDRGAVRLVTSRNLIMKRTVRQQPRFSYGKMFREAFETPEEKRQRQRDIEVASLSKRVTSLEEDFEDPEYRSVIGFR